MSHFMRDKGSRRPTQRLRELRANLTDAERRLWGMKQAAQAVGARSKRPFPIRRLASHVVPRTARLVIEEGGGQHAFDERGDAGRASYREAQGCRMLRFWNNDVIGNLDGVGARIRRVLADTRSPTSSREIEGSLGRSRGQAR